MKIHQNPLKSMKINSNGSDAAHQNPSKSINFLTLSFVEHQDVRLQQLTFLQTHGIGTIITRPFWFDQQRGQGGQG